MPHTERKRVPDHRSDVRISPPGSSCPSQGHGMSEAERREREGDETTQTGMEELYQRQCGSRSEQMRPAETVK